MANMNDILHVPAGLNNPRCYFLVHRIYRLMYQMVKRKQDEALRHTGLVEGHRIQVCVGLKIDFRSNKYGFMAVMQHSIFPQP